jgi:hypothetical protein
VELWSSGATHALPLCLECVQGKFYCAAVLPSCTWNSSKVCTGCRVDTRREFSTELIQYSRCLQLIWYNSWCSEYCVLNRQCHNMWCALQVTVHIATYVSAHTWTKSHNIKLQTHTIFTHHNTNNAVTYNILENNAMEGASHQSSGDLVTSHFTDCSLTPEQSIWELWWINWQSTMLYCKHFSCCPPSAIPPMLYIHIFISHCWFTKAHQRSQCVSLQSQKIKPVIFASINEFS